MNNDRNDDRILTLEKTEEIRKLMDIAKEKTEELDKTINQDMGQIINHINNAKIFIENEEDEKVGIELDKSLILLKRYNDKLDRRITYES